MLNSKYVCGEFWDINVWCAPVKEFIKSLKKMNNVIKFFLGILFFLCLADMPYGYYQLVRFVALVGFAILAYTANEQGHKTEVIIYICLAILFQPLIKIALGRQLWNIIDVIVGVVLLASIFFRPTNNSR